MALANVLTRMYDSELDTGPSSFWAGTCGRATTRVLDRRPRLRPRQINRRELRRRRIRPEIAHRETEGRFGEACARA